MKKIAILLGALMMFAGASGQPWTAVFVSGDLPVDPNAGVWAKATAYTVSLVPQTVTQPFGGGATTSVAIKSIHNSKEIAFLLEWTDETVDEAVGPDTYRDSAGLMFALDPKAPPSPFMGSKGGRVIIWQWKADWQAGLEGKSTYPSAYSDFTNPEDKVLFQGIGNQPRWGTPIEELAAEGFGTLTPKTEQTVLGKGIHANGKWKVVMIRRMGSASADNIAFSPGDTVLVNVAVWNGSAKEVSAKKSVSMVWHRLNIQKPLVTRTPKKK